MVSRDIQNKPLADAINEKLAEHELSHLEAYHEPVGSIDFMPRIDGKRTMIRNRIPEITIFWVINTVPGAVEEIQDLSQWFSNVSPRLPFVHISLSTGTFKNPGYNEQAGVEMPPPGVIHDDNPFPLEYHIIESHQGEGLRDELTIPNGLDVRIVENLTKEWLQETFFESIVDDLTRPSTEELVDLYAINTYVDAWEDAVFHFNEVLRAYRQDQIGLLIVLLSVYFESYIENTLREFFEQYRQNEHAGDFISDMTFHDQLAACRYFSLIGETEYDIVNKVKNSRNNYAHEISTFRNTEETQIEEEDLVEDAVEIYEEYIGLERSMLDE